MAAIMRTVFLDRDGVITCDPPHYAHRVDQVVLVSGSAEAIRLLNIHGFRVIVITNQPGVARGMYREYDIFLFNDEMKRQLAEYGACIDALYYCPHHPEAEVREYRVDCNCRKPRPGMILTARNDLGFSLDGSFLVGDKWSDIEAGNAAGCITILVKTGHGQAEYESKIGDVHFIVDDLLSAVTKVILHEDSCFSHI